MITVTHIWKLIWHTPTNQQPVANRRRRTKAQRKHKATGNFQSVIQMFVVCARLIVSFSVLLVWFLCVFFSFIQSFSSLRLICVLCTCNTWKEKTKTNFSCWSDRLADKNINLNRKKRKWYKYKRKHSPFERVCFGAFLSIVDSAGGAHTRARDYSMLYQKHVTVNEWMNE